MDRDEIRETQDLLAIESRPRPASTPRQVGQAEVHRELRAAYHGFDDAPIRSYVMVLTERAARAASDAGPVSAWHRPDHAAGRRSDGMTTLAPSAPPPASQDRPWYGLSGRRGLSGARRRSGGRPRPEAEVTQRRAQYGPNKLAEVAKEPAWKAFLRQYRDLMQLVLVGAALVSIIAIQDVSTGLVVLAITVVQRRCSACTRRARRPRASPRCARC